MTKQRDEMVYLQEMKRKKENLTEEIQEQEKKIA